MRRRVFSKNESLIGYPSVIQVLSKCQPWEHILVVCSSGCTSMWIHLYAKVTPMVKEEDAMTLTMVGILEQAGGRKAREEMIQYI